MRKKAKILEDHVVSFKVICSFQKEKPTFKKTHAQRPKEKYDRNEAAAVTSKGPLTTDLEGLAVRTTASPKLT